MEKVQVIKVLIKKTGCGLPKALEIYNKLSFNGLYVIWPKELNAYIKKNW